MKTDNYFRTLTSQRSTYVSSVGDLAKKRSAVYITFFYDSYLSPIPSTKEFAINTYNNNQTIPENRTTIGHYATGVFYDQFYWHWGHLIHDFFSAIIHLPKSVIDHGFITITPPSGRDMTNEYLTAFGYNTIQLIDLTPKQQVHVDSLIVLSSLYQSHGYSIGGIKRLRKLVFDRYDLHNIKPYKYSLINRPGKKRIIANVQELLDSLNKNVPVDGKWNEEKMNIHDFNSTVKIWSVAKVVVTPCGSSCYNSIAMQEMTGLLIMMSHILDVPNFVLAAASNICLVGVANPQINHDTEKPIPCNVDMMTAGASRLLDLIQKGHTYDSLFYVPNEVKVQEFNGIEVKELKFLESTYEETKLY
ncbi:hypothetical protein TVAG_309040 [Trichomonas vaginalis G3]|uniref:Glycosyltransferase 61 catalytic domain-containing protein n=1 Tax=Trichomonas vaginalis (strain ATCC PRA-98 / G3) TaxID=412133 RepID=A2EDQ0_TRIV3|nr:glycosyltransferase family [Trichomonas vaginalis G3]EAY09215.1 hypothetical protein TVAG_309040 [Trichomonas vaginalis G3]KAI5486796.1 glycosyltransferase family [Trichomonas vaginalis G3]|eukprot:XP_001321438.1 hypothetical protein [Trichomonas vaginalis G3]